MGGRRGEAHMEYASISSDERRALWHFLVNSSM